MSVTYKHANNSVSFLDHLWIEPGCQNIIKQMNDISLKQLGIEGADDPYYFKKDLNRVVIEGCEDYRLVLFFIKKGTKMHLHDHPNMSVFFKLLFGSLNY